jgi:phage terminase large subunit-like protein
MRELVVDFHPGQAAIYNSKARFKVVVAGRRFGKSYYAARALGLAALQEYARNGKPVAKDAGIYYVATTFDQAKRVMWGKLEEFLGYKSQGGLIARANANDGFFELINGRRIYLKGADNQETLRGEGYLLVVLDEYADMKSNIVTEIIRPALMDYEGDLLYIGTPKGKNHFYKIFMKALEYQYNPEKDPYPLYEAFHFKSVDNPTITRRELNMLMEDEGKSSDAVRQELDASFVSGGGKVLKPEWFEVVERPGGEQGSIVVTVDLAGFAKQRDKKILRTDESVIAVTLVTPECWYVLDILHGHWDVRETALHIVRTVSSHYGARLGIEQGALANAVGPYIDDYMREFSRYVTPEPLRHGNAKKTDRIVWALQGRSQRGKIKLIAGPWNQWFLDQVADFPDHLAHDDGLDAVAYVDQMASVDYSDDDDIDEWEPLDLESGY